MSKINDFINEIQFQRKLLKIKYNNEKENLIRTFFMNYQKAAEEYEKENDKINKKYDDFIRELLKRNTFGVKKYSKNN